MRKLILIVTLFTCWITGFSQTYPVQVNTQLIPPYSLKLSDYETTTSEKIFVNLLLTDISEIGRQVRLKMYIEGEGLNIQTVDFVAGAAPIFMDGGINLRLSNLDLQSYFSILNLQGITASQYNQTLPSGLYNFCFEVYDYNSGQRLSRKSCTPVALILNDPPFLNLPDNGDLISAQLPQNILFNWTPRHLNATNVQYEFTLKELWDTNIDPQTAFLSSPVLFQTTVFPTTFLYGPGELPLIEGKTYGWQVRAFVTDGISETSVFRNNGFSEIYNFVYQANCDPPTFVMSQANNSQTVTITWQSSPDHLRSNVQYRKIGYDDEEDWFEIEAYNTETVINNLEVGTTYEFRVGGECIVNGGYSYSTVQQFNTPTDEEDAYYNCGVMPTVTISNQDPLQNLGVNQSFTAGDFPVIAREVSGSNGVYSGWGFITMPFLEKFTEVIDIVNTATEGDVNIGKYTRIRVEFNNITINTDFQLIDGIVQTTYDPDWSGIANIDDIIDTIAGNNGDINQYDASSFDIDSVTVNENGNVVIIDNNGDSHTIITDLPVIITDTNGDQWQVNEDGTVIPLGQAAEGGVPTSSNTNGMSSSGNVNEITSPDVSITFTPSGYYNTDQLVTEKADKYETIDIAGGGTYNVLYKAVSNTPQAEDTINATATFSNGKTKDDVVFKTKQGSAIPFTWSGNTATLTVKKQFNFAKGEILATVKPIDSTENYDIAGKFNLWHFQQKSVNVTVVPLNGVAVTNNLSGQINDIYNKSGIDFNITVAPSFSIDPSVWDIDGDANGSLDIGDSSLLAQYTPEERAIYNYYKAEQGVIDDMYYIFLTNMTVTDPNTNGFMPLKRQYGFIFKQDAQARTIAHELGHGVFGLQHYEESSSANLLMYRENNSGTDFTHMDWQKMHAPGLQLYIFQGDEDGEQVTVSNMELLLPFENTDHSFTFISLSGKPITLPSNTSSVTFSTGDDINLSNCTDNFKIEPFGTLRHFKIDEIEYGYCATCNSTNFAGYFQKGTDCATSSKYIDTLSNINNKDVIIGMPCVTSGAVTFKVMKLNNYFNDFDFTTIGTSYNGSGELKPYDYLLADYNQIIDSDIIYVPANFDPAFDSDVIQFLSSEHCTCTENNFTSVAYGFVYATQLQKHKEYLNCFQSGVPLFFYDENIDTSDGLSHIIVEDWQAHNINGFNTLKNDTNKFKNLSNSFPNNNGLYEFLKKYVPEEISDSNANSYSLRFGTTYWETGFVFDRIQNISSTEISQQQDDVFCLWESISFIDRMDAIEYIADTDVTNSSDRHEEILLYLIINEPNKNLLIEELQFNDYNLFWKVWSVLDKKQRMIFINYLNRSLINETFKNIGKTNYQNFLDDCDNVILPCSNLTSYNTLPFYRANILNAIGFEFNLEPGGATYELDYTLSTSKNSNGKIHITANTNYINFSNINDYYTYFIQNGIEIFNSNINPFDPIVLMVNADIELNNQIVLNKGQIITVPAIYLHWMKTSIDSEQNQVLIRVIADAFIVGTIVATGGATTPLLALDLAVFGTDIFVTILNETEDIDPQFAETWDKIYTIYNIVQLPRAVMSGAELIANGTTKLFTFIENVSTSNRFSKLIFKTEYIDNFILEFGNLTHTKQSEIIYKIDNMITSLKNLTGVDAMITRKLYRGLVELRVKMNAAVLTEDFLLTFQASVTPFKPYLIAKIGSVSNSLGVIETSSNNLPILTEQILWLPEGASNTEVCLLHNMHYIENGVTKINDLKIVQSGTQFYLKVINSIETSYTTGAALANYLNSIPQAEMPAKIAFQTDLIRSLSLNAEQNYNAVAEQMTDHTVFSSWGRYDLDQQENAMYLSETLSGNKTEIMHYANQSSLNWTDWNTYRFRNVPLTDLLDLTNPNTIEKLRVLDSQLLMTNGGKEVIYEFTNIIASWARTNGYNGIIAYGARGNQDYKNVILFEQNYIDNVLQGITKLKIPKGLGEFENIIRPALVSKGLSNNDIDDILIIADDIDQLIGSDKMKQIILNLVSSNVGNYNNTGDLLSNLNSCLSGGNVVLGKANSLLNELEDGMYWMNRGEDVYISKKLTPNHTPDNEVDVVILNGSSKGIVECKLVHVAGANAQNNVFTNLQSIIGKFNNEARLESEWKNLYPKKFGQLKITNGSFQNLTTPSEFVDIIKDPNLNLIGTEDGNLFTLEQLRQLDELHLIIENRRIIIESSDW